MYFVAALLTSNDLDMVFKKILLWEKWVESPSWLRAFVMASAACLLVYLLNVIIDDVQPGNIWGLTYGTLATILMAGTALFGVRRRMVKIASKYRLGKAQTWVQFHLYGGALFLLLTLMHSGFRVPSGSLTWWLWLLSIWVTLSGFLGVALQKWIPRILTSGLALEVVYERIPELIMEIRGQAESLMETCATPVRDFYARNLATTLAAPRPRWVYYFDITGGIQSRIRDFAYLRRFLPAEEKEKVDRLESYYKTKLELDAHYTLQNTLRWWLYTHVPVSLVLLVLTVLHLYAVLYY